MLKNFEVPVEVCALIGVFFGLLAMLNTMALLETVSIALTSEPPVPGLASFIVNCLAIPAAGICGWWWFEQARGC